MTFGVVGDLHGNFSALDRILRRHPEVPFWLCVGDVASVTGAYPAPAAPLYWIKGNNEAFDRVEAFRDGTETIPNLHYIPNGARLQVGPITVAGVGGTFAPTWYDTPEAGLSRTPKDDKRRHFVREQVEACKALGGADVLLTHEAPTPFWVTLPSSTTPSKKWRRDVGKAPIAEVADALQPRLHCFGHHHLYATFTRRGIPTVCVDRVNRGYLLVDAASFAWEVREAR
ncbi:MAG TPA: metallophosphoesterase [Vicinamibacterales bacterium]|nr:metallophosphoesterase [Vicinamibacterales bacterium]